jgi:hypothetical protein
MVSPIALWLPILLSAVVVFVVSSIIHMALPWHKNDYPKIPNEDAVRAALRPLNIPPGSYMVRRPSSQKEMGSPEFLEKMKTPASRAAPSESARTTWWCSASSARRPSWAIRSRCGRCRYGTAAACR